MYVKEISLTKFRNYKQCSLNFSRGKNIIIGQNAQGKSNLLEAVDLLSSGKSSRAGEERELVMWGSRSASVKAEYNARGYDETLALEWKLKSPSAPAGSARVQKSIYVNGVQQQSIKDILGRMLTVSFSSEDLYLLRGGPKYRRDWLDNLAVRLRPNFHDVISNYAKSVMQRNKLLKTLAERGRLTVSDQDELLVWDKQLARFGTLIIKARLNLLADLLPLAEAEQAHLSRSHEVLTIDYAFRAQEESQDSSESDEDEGSKLNSEIKSMDEVRAMENMELAQLMLRLMKEKRWLELRRKQSLVGPHRDNLIFKLNGADAGTFASQGQQRSIVLSLKLAELKRIKADINEAPILLLDDVLAELDEERAGLLLATVAEEMQTIMSTTHISGIHPSWLQNAQIMTIHGGAVQDSDSLNLGLKT